MRVLLLTQLFDPENSIKGLSFCNALKRLGYDIEVVTTFPSYPGGLIYPGYRMRWLRIEYLDGIRVIRVPSYISHSRSVVKRVISYSSFAFFSFFYSLIFARKFSIVYAYHPAMMSGVAAVFLKIFTRCSVVYDVQDLWPEAVVATGNFKNRRLVDFIERVMGFVYRRCDAIVTLSDGYVQALMRKNVPACKIYKVYNWCDEGRIDFGGRGLKNNSEYFDFVYAGNLGAAQALKFVVDAAAILKSRGNKRIRFIFIGDGVEKEGLVFRAKSLGLNNVIFKDRVSPDLIGKELGEADALLVHLNNDDVFKITVPQKTQAYLAAGKPILMAVSGEAASLVHAAKAGIIVNPCDPVDIARGAEELANLSRAVLADFGKAGQDFYLKNLSLESGVNKISDIFKRISTYF